MRAYGAALRVRTVYQDARASIQHNGCRVFKHTVTRQPGRGSQGEMRDAAKHLLQADGSGLQWVVLGSLGAHPCYY